MTWRDKYREHYLAQNVALEGRGRLWGPCAMCGGSALFRCVDCVIACSMCRSCAVKVHRNAPLHILQVSMVLLLLPMVLINIVRNGRLLTFNG